ncbi:hypothetical protein EB796_011773 [Bugula neritina]|uniref:Uncharacterized protein n=1 Tax=Bugula neritina TaxID=10212 RepID=A0A7J7JVF7_BUGNE|nr:hypothetical protein EB796_011773 [Bugula neritina]
MVMNITLEMIFLLGIVPTTALKEVTNTLVYKMDSSAHVEHHMVHTESWIRMSAVLSALLMVWNVVDFTATLFTEQTTLVATKTTMRYLIIILICQMMRLPRVVAQNTVRLTDIVLLDFGLGGIVTVEITSTDLIKLQMKNAIGGVLITLNSAVGELLNNLFITLLTKRFASKTIYLQ